MHFLKIITLLTFHDRNVEHYMKLLILKAILMEKQLKEIFSEPLLVKVPSFGIKTQFSVMKNLHRTYLRKRAMLKHFMMTLFPFGRFPSFVLFGDH